MDDRKIIEKLFSRDETALEDVRKNYSSLCYDISLRILRSAEDARECENDTYLRLWNTVPPKNPPSLKNYLCLLTRSISLDRYRKQNAKKRTGCVALNLSELEECIPEGKEIYEELEEKELAHIISKFLRKLPKYECNVFILRYHSFLSVGEIAKKYGFSQSKVKMMLLRSREKLRTELEKEGVFV